MGRSSTGAITTGAATRIELSFLIKNKYLKKDSITNSTISWTNGSAINLKCVYNDFEIYIELRYQNTDHWDEITNLNYRIYLNEVPSNLGKGNVLYFICPSTNKNCRILYKSYGSLKFKSRNAYSKRIFYESQMASNNSYYNDMYWNYENKVLSKLENRIKNSHYRGKPTKAQKDYERAINKRDYYDNMRFGVLRKMVENHL